MNHKQFYVGLIVFLFTAMFFIQTAAAAGSWVEYASNPVFVTGHKAYYPYVLYDANQFSSHGDSYYYKMWYSTGETVRLAYSDDGITWAKQGGGDIDLNTLTNPNHPVVLYDVNGFGGGAYYKMWYWDSSSEYSNPIRTAESTDGVNWINDQAITQDPSAKLVEGWVAPYWFYSSYGAGAILYNSAGYNAINYGDPMGNKYVMYYDAASQGYAPDGTSEGTALAFSADGIYWARYGSEPVLKASGGSAWDSGYAYAWSVLKINGQYEMYYSGGQSASNAGIGYAVSSDGITWTNQATPIIQVSDGVTWRSERTYTPSVVYDANQFSGHGESSAFKMWYTGVSGSGYAIGYASIPSIFVTPEYPIGGGLAALLICGVALTAYKLRKK
jgi:hypothetical protein